MSTKTKITILLVAVFSILALAISPRLAKTVRAISPALTGAPSHPGVTIPYAGTLTDETGRPVTDSAYDFIFSLYANENGGEPLWTETQAGMMVKDGAFETLLGRLNPIPLDVVSNNARWLEVAVRGPGEVNFTALAPRQALSVTSSAAPASPSAGPSCAHDHVGEEWTANINWSNGAFKIYNYGNGPTIWGWNGGGGNGLRGYATGAGYGVYGESMDSYGIFGRSTTSFGMGAAGKDDLYTDRVGDLFLDGSRGEITTWGNMALYTDNYLYIDLDDDNDNSNSCFQILNGADTIVSQTCENGTKSAVLRTQDYDQRAVYVVESPEVWLEDFGTASLVDGEATVTFEPIFAETVNLQMDYHVYVTPLCQKPVWLYVTAKTAAGFTVEGVTLDDQPADCAFDYHVVAKRLGLEDLRLEQVSNSRLETQP